MNIFCQALQWVSDSVSHYRNLSTHLETACNSPASIERSGTYYGSRNMAKLDSRFTEKAMTNDQHNKDGSEISNKDKPTEKILEEVHSEPKCSVTDESFSRPTSEKRKTSVSPFDFKTLVVVPVIPDLPGAKIAEIKPNPAGQKNAPVVLGIVRSSTGRFNEISPPCQGVSNTLTKPMDRFNRRMLKEKSESFAGIENFRQKRPEEVPKLNSDRDINIIQISFDGLFLPAHSMDIRKAASDSKTLHDIKDTFTMPGIDTESSLSIFPSSSVKLDNECKPSFDKHETLSVTGQNLIMRKSAEVLQTNKVPLVIESHYDSLQSSEMPENDSMKKYSRLQKLRPKNEEIEKLRSKICTRRHSTPNAYAVRDNHLGTLSEVMANTRKIDTYTEFRKAKYRDSRLSLFSLPTGKRCELDQAPEKTSKSSSTCLMKTPEKTDANELTSPSTGKKGKETVIKRMSLTEHQMRTAQIALYRNFISVDKTNELGRIQFIIHYSEFSRMLTVTALKVSGIQRPKKCSCIFATVNLKAGERSLKTQSTKKTKFSDNLEFLEAFEFPNFLSERIQDMTLKIVVYSKQSFFSFPKFIGQTYASLNDFDLNVGKPVWKILRPKAWKVC